VGHDVGACDVDIVGFIEAIAERDLASNVLDVEGGTWDRLVGSERRKTGCGRYKPALLTR